MIIKRHQKMLPRPILGGLAQHKLCVAKNRRGPTAPPRYRATALAAALADIQAGFTLPCVLASLQSIGSFPVCAFEGRLQ